MHKLPSLFLILLYVSGVYAQTDNDRAEWIARMTDEMKLTNVVSNNAVTRSNFAPLWIRLTDNASVFGYIGDDYQRMRIVLLTATKNPKQPDTYNVTGKSMVKNVVRSFSGTMKITKTSSAKGSELDEEYNGEDVKEAGAVFGEYHFVEDPKQTSTGKFDGVFLTNWVIDKSGRLKYDEVMMGADGWSNNQFLGTWTSYKSKTSKPASWGDSRIPVSGNLDIGAGEFSPDETYLRNGWQGYRDAYVGQNKRALAEERRQWWR